MDGCVKLLREGMASRCSLRPWGRLVTWLSVGLLVACGGGHAQGPGGAFQFKPQVSVVTLHPQSVNLTRELPGRTSAFLVAEVRPQVSGIVKRRLFTEGALVKAGQPLYELDDAIYRAQYDSAQAALLKARATLDAAQLAAKRSAALVKVDAISAQDNENAIASLRQAEADVAAAQASVEGSAINLAYAHIAAPISGRIGKSAVTQGALVTANQTAPLATVQQLDPIYVDVNQSSGEWLQFQHEVGAGFVRSGEGGAAKILLEDGSVYAHEGKLQFADVTVEQSTGNFLLRVLVPNPDRLLMPGMYVRAVISEGVLPQGLLVPQQGVTHDALGRATALVVAPSGNVEQRVVKATRAVGNQWLVDAGLAAGDRVIVEGLQKVQPGMPVEAVEAPVSAQQTGGSDTRTALAAH
jgi:membrane fusion protein (multidrug efflux system)